MVFRVKSWGWVTDAAALVVMLAVGLVGLWPAFGGPAFLRPVAVGLVLGLGIAWLGAWRRWPTVVVGTAVVVAYFVFGAAAALWTRARAGVVPSLDNLRSLAFGAVEVWRQFVTATTPLGSFYGFMLVPFILALLAGVGSATIAWRSRRPGLALVPVGLTAAGAILLGTSNPFQPVAQAVVLATVAMAWLAWKTTGPAGGLTGANRSGTAVRRARVIRAAIALAGAALVATAAGPWLAGGLDREVIRRHTLPPLDTRAFASPLISFRSLVDTQADDVLFTVSGWDKGYSLRLAVMDTYDGMVYNVGQASGASRYDRVGPDVGAPAPPERAVQADVTVTVGDYAGVWLPSVSILQTLNFTGQRADELTQSLYYNPVSDAVIDPVGLGSGAAYRLTAAVDAARPAADTPLMPVTLPEPQWVPAKLTDLARQWSGTDKSALRRVEGIVDTLRSTGYFSHGLESEKPSKPGHSSFRIAQLIDNPKAMLGDDEQYAVAAALMLSSVGIPARVVMGFSVGADSAVDGATWQVKGSDAHAWVEVPFQGFGWVPFYPTPDDQNQDRRADDLKSRAKPKPQVLQPPPPINEAQTDSLQSPPEPKPKEDQDKKDHPIDWAKVARVAAAVGVPLIVVVAPWVVIWAIKRARTKSRRRTGDPTLGVALGWQELLDRAADLGLVVPATATRHEVSAALDRTRRFTGLERLAHVADEGTFAPRPLPPDRVNAFWDDIGSAATTLAQTFSRRRRFIAKIAWTSLLRRPKPTVEIGPA